MRSIITFLACLALGSTAVGCSRSGEWCDAKCECEGCSDRQYDECLIDQDYVEDRADVYGCGDLYALAHDCTMVNNDCSVTGVPGADIEIFRHEAECNDEWFDVSECIDDNSAIR